MTVNKNLSGIYVIEPHQQFDHSSLSCTSRSYNGYFLSFLYFGVKIMDNHMIRIITESYMASFYISAEGMDIHRVLHSLVFFFLIQKLENSLCGSR